MISHIAKIRVRYAETDKMQFVYNGNYLEYFEVGRTELLRSVGLPYSVLEKNGYQLPVIEARLFYKNPAFYDDVLHVEAFLKEINSAKVHIEYVIKKENDDKVIVSGYTSHVFMNEKSKKPTKPPQIYIDALKKYFT